LKCITQPFLTLTVATMTAAPNASGSTETTTSDLAQLELPIASDLVEAEGSKLIMRSEKTEKTLKSASNKVKSKNKRRK